MMEEAGKKLTTGMCKRAEQADVAARAKNDVVAVRRSNKMGGRKEAIICSQPMSSEDRHCQDGKENVSGGGNVRWQSESTQDATATCRRVEPGEQLSTYSSQAAATASSPNKFFIMIPLI